MGILLPVLVGLAVGITMVISFAVFMPTLPLKQPETVWMALDIGQCSFPWSSFFEPGTPMTVAMQKYYFEKHDLEIYEVNSIISPKFSDPSFFGYIPCEACSCYGGTYEARMDRGEMEKAKALGFYSFERPSEQP